MDAKIFLLALMVHCACEILADEQTSTVPIPSEQVPNAQPAIVSDAHNDVEPRAYPLSNLRRYCGLSDAIQLRIVGGEPAQPHSWPWLAAIFLRQKSTHNVACGGVLISEEYILTAAHCVNLPETNELRDKSDYIIRLGEHDIRQSDADSTVELGALELIPHPMFDRAKVLNDIALIRLSQPVRFNQFITPICLPDNPYQTYIGMNPYVAGWGRLQYKGEKNYILRQRVVPVLDNSDCEELAHQFRIEVNEDHICAGYLQGGKDACQGDSGGPLMLADSNNRVTAIGVISFGYKCGQPGYPGVYTRVSTYVPWIKQMTGI